MNVMGLVAPQMMQENMLKKLLFEELNDSWNIAKKLFLKVYWTQKTNLVQEFLEEEAGNKNVWNFFSV